LSDVHFEFDGNCLTAKSTHDLGGILVALMALAVFVANDIWTVVRLLAC
jgi:hypothetical protein